jgi:hypothetical protein
MKPTGTPRIWQMHRRERHWAKFAEQIISRTKTIVFSSEQEKFDALDKMMNDVYQAVHSFTSPDRFAKVKQEQIAWLKNSRRRTVRRRKGEADRKQN